MTVFTYHSVREKLPTISLLLLTVLFLGSCQSERQELDGYVQNVLSRPSGAIEEIPSIRTADSFVYDPTDLRDPFRRPEQEVEAAQNTDGPRPDPERRREFLERFPLDTLGMVGTFTRENQVWGLVQDVDGVVHRVSENNYVGQNHGRVTAILPDRVILLELLPNGDGSWVERESSISLAQDDA